jgi:hypothetical protein
VWGGIGAAQRTANLQAGVVALQVFDGTALHAAGDGWSTKPQVLACGLLLSAVPADMGTKAVREVVVSAQVFS